VASRRVAIMDNGAMKGGFLRPDIIKKSPRLEDFCQLHFFERRRRGAQFR